MIQLWDNPLFPVEERLDMAIGAIQFRDKVLASVANRFEDQAKRLERAERALTRAGYTFTEGAEEWRPPIGKPPRFRESDITTMSVAMRGAITDQCAYWQGWPGTDRLAQIAYDAIYAAVEKRS